MQASLFELPVVQQLSPSISLRQKDQLTLLIIRHTAFDAALSLQGGQLLAWQPTTSHPVIWLSEKTEFTRGKAIRGGVPICWPWFGPAGKPAHGFARTSEWQLTDQHEDNHGVNITLGLNQSEQTLPLWPHEFTLALNVSLSAERCQLELLIDTTSDSTAALHSYFQVGDISNVAVEGLGESYIDKVADNHIGHQVGAQHYQQEVDRIFTAPSPISTIVDPTLKRHIELVHRGNSDVVTWNPWQNLSSSMSDMADEGYKTMVCVETACIHRPLSATLSTPATLAVTITPRYHD